MGFGKKGDYRLRNGGGLVRRPSPKLDLLDAQDAGLVGGPARPGSVGPVSISFAQMRSRFDREPESLLPKGVENGLEPKEPQSHFTNRPHEQGCAASDGGR
jgi:hypothetical protein